MRLKSGASLNSSESDKQMQNQAKTGLGLVLVLHTPKSWSCMPRDLGFGHGLDVTHSGLVLVFQVFSWS